MGRQRPISLSRHGYRICQQGGVGRVVGRRGLGTARVPQPAGLWRDPFPVSAPYRLDAVSVRHSGRLDPRGTRIGSDHEGGVCEKRTGGATMWTSPNGVGAS